MRIKKIVVYRRERKIKIELENKQYIIYSKFANSLFCGDRCSEVIKKSSPILQQIKRKAINLDYFQNNTTEIALADIVAAEKELKQFENKIVETI